MEQERPIRLRLVLCGWTGCEAKVFVNLEMPGQKPEKVFCPEHQGESR